MKAGVCPGELRCRRVECYGQKLQRQVENFTMRTTNQKQPDQNRIVATLASQCHLPIGEMARLYEHERAELAAGAHITKYLHIFATRNVLKLLRKRRFERRDLALAPVARAGV
jgi:hypothetical protein